MLQLLENGELRRQRFVPVEQFGAVGADDFASQNISGLPALAEPGMAPQYDEIVALMQKLGELRVRLVVLIGKGIFAVPVHPATADVAGHKRPRLMALINRSEPGCSGYRRESAGFVCCNGSLYLAPKLVFFVIKQGSVGQ
jgi:hypothetical protein